MKNLKNLKLTRAVFEPRWLEHLSDLPLKVLGLSGTPLTDEAITYTVDMKDLESLDIGEAEVTDKGLKLLSSAKSITHLDINLARHITKDGIRHIGEMKQLRKLELATCRKVTEKCLANIVNLNNLAYLNLRDMKIVPGNLSYLSSLKNLLMIDLSNCNLSDPLVSEVAKIDSLYNLNISGSNFTNKSLPELAKLKHLNRLVIKNCPKVDECAVKKFQTILPGCRVKYSHSNSLSKKLKSDEYRMEVEFLKNEASTQLKKLKHNPK